jgi:hypothetical protein
MLQSRLLVSALLALLAIVSGCSSDNGEPVGASPPPVTPSSVTRSASPSVDPSVDEFAFPDDVKLEFETPPTGDETQDAVLEAWMNFEKSVVKAALSESWSDRTYQKYSSPPVQLAVGEYLRRKRATNSSVIGTRRFYDIHIDAGEGVGTITACRDDQVFYGRDLDTGRAILTTPGIGSFSELAIALIQNAKHGWLVESYVPNDRAKDCVR